MSAWPWKWPAERRSRAQDTERAAARAKGIFEDLLNLEINVIITPGMTARKMPDAWNALGNIVEAYGGLLRGFSIDVQRLWKEEGSPRVEVYAKSAENRSKERPRLSMVGDNGRIMQIHVGELAAEVEAPSLEAFNRLRVWAIEAAAVSCALLATPGWPHPDKMNQQVVLLKRIERNCDQLKHMMEPPPGSKAEPVVPEPNMTLDAEHLLTVRKIWEVGTSTVVMQTVIQLDGDFVTRIHEGHIGASDKAMHDLHRQSVESAIQNWQFLGQTVAQFLTSVLKGLF